MCTDEIPIDVEAFRPYSILMMNNTTIHGVLAGAYLNRGKASLKTMLTHASIDGGRTALCGGVKEWALCDEELAGPPTCERCRGKTERMVR
jgi:hypothetical protein